MNTDWNAPVPEAHDLTLDQCTALENWLNMQSAENAAKLKEVGLEPSNNLYNFACKFFNRPWVEPDCD